MADPKKIIKGATSVGKKLLAEPAPAYTSKILESTTAKFADKIADANPKLSDAEVQKKALAQATKKLEWERVQKPALEKRYGPLAKASFAESNPNKMQNTAEVVAERKRKANEFLDQPTEPWTPPPAELQAFDRASIKDALEGFPDVEQSRFPRDQPARASTSHVEELYNDPENRALIEKQIKRGLPLGGETFYASLYPVKKAVMEAGMPAEKFDKWIHSLAPASARNSIMNEMAVGQFLRNMNARGIPLTEENVAREMAAYKNKFGIGLPLMPIHRQGVQSVLEGGMNLRDQNLANIPTNYKIPTYGTQKAGDFANSAVLDVHEAGGHTQGSRFHPYFNEQGGFGNTEYGKGEEGLLGIAEDLGIPGGMAQAGRWFGGGELTGLKSPRGDALDLLEKQVAFTLQQKGIQPNPANVRKEVLRQIETGEGDLLPWYRKEAMPDVRETGLQRAEGGEVDIDAADARLSDAIANRMAKGGSVDIEASDARLQAAIDARMGMAEGGGAFKKIQFMAGGGKPEAVKGVAKVFKKLLADAPVEQKIIQPPSIIIPSKVSNVKEAIRKSKGDFGARRVERAADEIPNLEKLYKEEALREAFGGDNAKALITMNPRNFEKFAHPLTPREKPWPGSGPKKENLPTSEYVKYLSELDEFHDIPFLEINKQEQGLPLMPFISGHEGRHRNRALAERGESAGLVQLLPRTELREPFPRRSQDEYLQALRDELDITGNLVLPEKYSVPSDSVFDRQIQRPAIVLPDIYAKGGDVHMAGGGKPGKVVSGLANIGKRLMADAPQAEALKLAQERAALPPAKGGLGLPKNNTPEQRAKAMNRDTDAYHGSKQDITGAFQPGYDDNLAFVTKSPEFANKWIGKGKHTQRTGEQAKQEIKSAEDMYRDIRSRNINYNDELERLKGDEFNAEYDRRSALARAEAQKEFGTRGTPDAIHSTVYPLTVQSKKIFNPETDMDVMAEFFEKNDIPKNVQDLYAGGNYMMYETKPVVAYLKSKGYDSMRLRESTGDDYPTIAVFNPESVRSKFAAHDPFRKDAATAIAMGVAAPDLLAKEQDKAEGGSVFKTLQFKEPQHFDGGGMAVDLSQPSEGSRREPLLTEKDLANIKRNAPEVYEWAKQNVKDEASQLKSARGVRDFALRTGAQYLGGIPDLVNLGLMGVDALADTNLSSEKPWFGSEQYIDALKRYGAIGENEFPIAETVAGVLAPAGLIKRGVKQLRKPRPKEEPKKQRGGLAAMAR
jgi:hypothetical protein